MARCSKSDGRLSPISVDGKTHENLFVQQMKGFKAIIRYFCNTFGLASGTKVTFPCNYPRMIHLSSHGVSVTVFSANALGKEAEQAVASLENQLRREPRFHQALHDLTESCGANSAPGLYNTRYPLSVWWTSHPPNPKYKLLHPNMSMFLDPPEWSSV